MGTINHGRRPNVRTRGVFPEQSNQLGGNYRKLCRKSSRNERRKPAKGREELNFSESNDDDHHESV